MAEGKNMGVAEYVPVPHKKLPKSRNPLTSDSKFWRQFKKVIAEKQISAVTCIHFCPTPPYDFAITSSTRVVIYDGKTCAVKKTISKFTDVAYSGHFRSDGQLLVAGGEAGSVQVFDAAGNTILRQLKGHSRAVHWVQYSEFDKTHVLSASDDKTVRWWDVAGQVELQKFEEHTDYVRCGAPNPSSTHIWATGSYDHIVKLWDTRTSKSVGCFEHGKPVEDVVFFPSGGLLATAGGNFVKIWDVVGGGKLINVLGNHQKTVTSLAIALSRKTGSNEASPRLLTSSLDGLLKVFDIGDFKVNHVARYPAPILSMGVSANCTTLAVGMSSFLLSVRQRKVQPEETQDALLQQSEQNMLGHGQETLRPSARRYFSRGQSEKASDEDYVVPGRKAPRMGEYDRLLRQFRYKDSLVAALRTMDPTIILAVMEELVARDGLLSTFSKLDLTELELLIGFLQKYSTLPQYSRFLIPISEKVLEKCSNNMGLTPSLKDKILTFREKVLTEVRLQESLQSLHGLMQILIRH